MGRASSPAGRAANGPWCAAHRRDGEPCGHRVPTYGSLCPQHRLIAERRRREERERWKHAGLEYAKREGRDTP